MRLNEKITRMRQEAGITGMLCIITECEDACRTSKSTYKPLEIPYVYMSKSGKGLMQYSICLKKVEEYWKK